MQIVQIELRVIVEQIRSLNKSIAELEKTIAEEGSKLEGHKNLTSIKGIGQITGAHSAERDRRRQRLRRRGPAGQLTSGSCRGCRTRMRPSTRPHSQTRQQAGPHGAGAIGADRGQLQPVSEAVLRTESKRGAEPAKRSSLWRGSSWASSIGR